MDPEDLARMTAEEKHELLDSLESWTPEHEKVCRALAGDPDPAVRARAMEGFWEFAEEEDLGSLCEVVRTDADPRVRAATCKVLGRFVYEAAVLEELEEERYIPLRQLLLQCFDAPHEETAVRGGALEALSFDPGEDVLQRIEEAYRSESPELKVGALLAMGRSGAPTWTEILLDELRSPDPAVRTASVQAVGEAQVGQAVPLLLEIAERAAGQEREVAIWSLGHIGGRAAEEALDRLVSSPHEEVRRLAVEARKESKAMQEVEKELAALWDEDEDWDEDDWDDEDDEDWDEDDWDDEDDEDWDEDDWDDEDEEDWDEEDWDDEDEED